MCPQSLSESSQTTAALEARQLSQLINRFGLRALACASGQVAGPVSARTNPTVAPLNLADAFLLLREASAGQSRESIDRLLGLSDSSFAAGDLSKVRSALIREIVSGNTDESRFLESTSIWTGPSLQLLPSFGELAQREFHALCRPYEIPAFIQWLSSATENLICARSPEAPERQGFILATACVFDGKWKKPFPGENTKPQRFTLASGEFVTVPMMSVTDEFRYHDSAEGQIAALQYGDEWGYRMVVVLPAQGTSASQMIRNLDSPEGWSAWLEKLQFQKGTIQMPRHDIDHEMRIGPLLKALNAEALLTDRPDLSLMCASNAVLDGEASRHLTRVIVDEEGTKAAATTVSYLYCPAPEKPAPPFSLILNREYLFFIEHAPTSTILFGGIVRNPSQH